MKIPNILHQMWIGPKPMPQSMMRTWREKHPDFEYIVWTEDEIAKRQMTFQCAEAIHLIPELCGKVDIMRWEILYQYGGIFIDADSICIHPLDDVILRDTTTAFAAYENETLRKDLVAVGTMGFTPRHPICQYAIQWIRDNTYTEITSVCRAWKTVGPTLLTRALDAVPNHQVTVLPSFTFLPIHHTGVRYQGHRKVYAYQEWGSTKNNYDYLSLLATLPREIREQPLWVSVLITSQNRKQRYLEDCLQSILNQLGDFSIEIVWINDNSDETHTHLLKTTLQAALKQSRFITIKTKRNKPGRGFIHALNEGLRLCSHEYVFKMDSDDIMHAMRMFKQLEYMMSHPECPVCGTNVLMFREDAATGDPVFLTQTNHPERLTWQEYRAAPSHWFMNHPTLCYRKSAVLSVGGYQDEIYAEDLHLEVRLLKKYGSIANLEDVLLYYRIHPDQMTYQGKHNTPETVRKRQAFIQRITSSSSSA